MKSLFLALTILLILHGRACETYSCPEYDVAFDGNDISMVRVIEWGSCGQVCTLTTGCNFWTYSGKFHGNLCWLKSSDSGLKSDGGFISGAKHCP